jgi:hypothetical protein
MAQLLWHIEKEDAVVARVGRLQRENLALRDRAQELEVGEQTERFLEGG